jgi:hypothetical protein
MVELGGVLGGRDLNKQTRREIVAKVNDDGLWKRWKTDFTTA